MTFRALRATLAAGAVVIAGAGAASAITVAPRVAAMESLVATGYGIFDIVLDYGGATPDPTYEAAFSAAELFWESQISGYRQVTTANSVTFNAQPLDITVTLRSIDGAGKILGGAGTTSYWDGTIYKTARTGAMEFDTDDIGSMSSERLGFLILHEMGHVLGLNPYIWQINDAVSGYVDTGVAETSYYSQYVGADGLAAYNIENGGTSATSIMLEDEGGSGTRGAHWNEETFLGAYSDQGNPELMTGYLGTTAYLSQTTLFALQDVGFALAATAVPVPAAGGLLAAGLGVMGLIRRRRRAA